MRPEYECEHGRLKTQCEKCAVLALTARLAEAEQLLRECDSLLTDTPDGGGFVPAGLRDFLRTADNAGVRRDPRCTHPKTLIDGDGQLRCVLCRATLNGEASHE